MNIQKNYCDVTFYDGLWHLFSILVPTRRAPPKHELLKQKGKALCKRSNIVGPTSSNIVDNVDLTIILEVYHRIFPNLYFLIIIACKLTIYIFYFYFFFIKFIGNSTENYIQNTMRQNKKEESRKGQKGVSNGTEVPMLGHSL